MSDIATAPAPAEAAPAAVITDAPALPPNPIDVAQPEAPRAEPAKAPSIDEALEKAFATETKAEAKAEPAKVEAKAPDKAPPKTEAIRDETGKFAPKAVVEPPAETKPVQTARIEPPARFRDDAKAAWESTPDPVKHEISRALRENEAGLQKYKADSEAYEPVREFAELAKKNGSDLRTALTKIVGIEQAFQRNPLEGFEAIANHFGIPLRAVAAHIMGQSPDQQATQTESTIRALNAKIAHLEQQIGGVTKTIETQRTEGITQTVAQFAAQPGHERFEDLSSDIAFFLNSGRAKDLAEAYSLAERLNPAPAGLTTASDAAFKLTTASDADAPDIEAQTLKGTRSVAGSPSPGTKPGARGKAPSIDEALRSAFA